MKKAPPRKQDVAGPGGVCVAALVPNGRWRGPAPARPLHFTAHALQRLRQRAISQDQCRALFQHGLRRDSHGGCVKVYDNQLVLVVVPGRSSKVVTAYWLGHDSFVQDVWRHVPCFTDDQWSAM